MNNADVKQPFEAKDCVSENGNGLSAAHTQIEQSFWLIEKNNAFYFATLFSNEETPLLRTQNYPSLSAVKSGIDTIKNNIDWENFAIDLNENGKYIFKLFSTAKRTLLLSDEFKSLNECEQNFFAIKAAAATAQKKVNI